MFGLAAAPDTETTCPRSRSPANPRDADHRRIADGLAIGTGAKRCEGERRAVAGVEPQIGAPAKVQCAVQNRKRATIRLIAVELI